MTKVRVKVLGTLAAAGALALSTTPAMAAAPSAPRPAPYTCTGGVIPSGSYSSLTVSGPCSVATGAQITVGGNVNVGAGAVLDAQSAPSTITVGGNVTTTGAPGVYIVRNTINGNLTCVGLAPGVSGGFVPGSVNVVGRNAIGQCAALV